MSDMRILSGRGRILWRAKLDRQLETSGWNKQSAVAEEMAVDKGLISKFFNGDEATLTSWLDAKPERGKQLARVLKWSFEELLAAYDRASAGDEEPLATSWHPSFPKVPDGAILIEPMWDGPRLDALKSSAGGNGRPETAPGLGPEHARRWFLLNGVTFSEGRSGSGVGMVRLRPWGEPQVRQTVQKLAEGRFLEGTELENAKAFAAAVEVDPAILGPIRTPRAIIELIASSSRTGAPTSVVEVRDRIRRSNWDVLERSPHGAIFAALGENTVNQILAEGWLACARTRPEWAEAVARVLPTIEACDLAEALSAVRERKRGGDSIQKLEAALGLREPTRIVAALEDVGLIREIGVNEQLVAPDMQRLRVASFWCRAGLPNRFWSAVGRADALASLREAAASGLAAEQLIGALAKAPTPVDRCRAFMAFAANAPLAVVKPLSLDGRFPKWWAGSIWALLSGALEDVSTDFVATRWRELANGLGAEAADVASDIRAVTRRFANTLPLLIGPDLVQALQPFVSAGLRDFCRLWSPSPGESLSRGVADLAWPVVLPVGMTHTKPPDWDVLQRRAPRDTAVAAILAGDQPEFAAWTEAPLSLHVKWIGGAGKLTRDSLPRLERAVSRLCSERRAELRDGVLARLDGGLLDESLVAALDLKHYPPEETLLKFIAPETWKHTSDRALVDQVLATAVAFRRVTVVRRVFHDCLGWYPDPVELALASAEHLYNMGSLAELRSLADGTATLADGAHRSARIMAESGFSHSFGWGSSCETMFTEADWEEQLVRLRDHGVFREPLLHHALDTRSLSAVRSLLVSELALRLVPKRTAEILEVRRGLSPDATRDGSAEGVVRFVLRCSNFGDIDRALTPAFRSWLATQARQDIAVDPLRIARRDLRDKALEVLVQRGDELELRYWSQRFESAEDLPGPNQLTWDERYRRVDRALCTDSELLPRVMELGAGPKAEAELLRRASEFRRDYMYPDWIFEMLEVSGDTDQLASFATLHSADRRTRPILERLAAHARRAGDLVQAAYWSAAFGGPIDDAVDAWVTQANPLSEPFKFIRVHDGLWRGGVCAFIDACWRRRDAVAVRRLLETVTAEHLQWREQRLPPGQYPAQVLAGASELSPDIATALRSAAEDLLDPDALDAALQILPLDIVDKLGLLGRWARRAPIAGLWALVDAEDAWARNLVLSGALVERDPAGFVEWAKQRHAKGERDALPQLFGLDEAAWLELSVQEVYRASPEEAMEKIRELLTYSAYSPAAGERARAMLSNIAQP